MKKIYSFIVNKEIEKDIESISTNDAGETVKTIKKEKVLTPFSFFIRKPNRVLNDEARLFYGVELAKMIKAGLLTVAQLNKRYDNDGGALSDTEKKNRLSLYQELIKLQESHEKLILDKVSDKSEELITKIAESEKQIIETQVSLRRMEDEYTRLFDNTAEGQARNKILLWWTLNLAYKDVDNKEIPFFAGDTFESKLSNLDKYDEEDDTFIKEVINKFSYLLTFWFLTGSEEAKEYQNYLNLYSANK